MYLNPYHKIILVHFGRLNELWHTALQIQSALRRSIENVDSFKTEGTISASNLVISDWTGNTDKGWASQFPTGIKNSVSKAEYKKEVNILISNECCYLFAQAFESLERFLKDCIFYKLCNDEKLKDYYIQKTSKGVSRDSIPGGYLLFRLLKRSCYDEFERGSKQNNCNIKFKEFWTVLSLCRHSVIHSDSLISRKKVFKSYHPKEIFYFFFEVVDFDSEVLRISLNVTELRRLLKSIAEFAFQLYRSICKTEKLDWNFLKK